MVNMSNTKAQLLAAYTTVVAESLAQGHTIRALRDELAMAQPVNAPVKRAIDQDLRTRYYAYVNKCRASQTSHVKSYLSLSAWSQSIVA